MYFDIKSWIKKYFGLNQSDNTFDKTNNSLEFIWVWSLFEHKYLKDSKTNKSYNEQLIELADKFPNKKIDIDTIYGFLYNRYVQNGKTTKNFGDLNFNKDWKNLCQGILKKSKPENKDKLIFIFLVLYKFRCNLFHGRKDPLLWKNFDITFYHFNKFLADFLDTKWNPKQKKLTNFK